MGRPFTLFVRSAAVDLTAEASVAGRPSTMPWTNGVACSAERRSFILNIREVA